MSDPDEGHSAAIKSQPDVKNDRKQLDWTGTTEGITSRKMAKYKRKGTEEWERTLRNHRFDDSETCALGARELDSRSRNAG